MTQTERYKLEFQVLKDGQVIEYFDGTKDAGARQEAIDCARKLADEDKKSSFKVDKVEMFLDARTAVWPPSTDDEGISL